MLQTPYQACGVGFPEAEGVDLPWHCVWLVGQVQWLWLVILVG